MSNQVECCMTVNQWKEQLAKLDGRKEVVFMSRNEVFAVKSITDCRNDACVQIILEPYGEEKPHVA